MYNFKDKNHIGRLKTLKSCQNHGPYKYETAWTAVTQYAIMYRL